MTTFLMGFFLAWVWLLCILTQTLSVIYISYTLLYSENIVSLSSHTVVGPYSLSDLSSTMNPKIWEEGLWYRFGTEQSVALFSASYSIVNLCISCHPLQRKLLWWRLRESMTYKHNNKSLVVILLLCPFIRTIAAGFSHGSMTCLAQVLGSDNGDKYGFHFVEQVLSQITKCLVTSTPIFHWLVSNYLLMDSQDWIIF